MVFNHLLGEMIVYNSLLIKNNKISFLSDESVDCKDSIITFKKSGTYVLEYVDCSNIKYDVVILDHVEIELVIFSRDNDLKIYQKYDLGTRSSLRLFQFFDNKRVSYEAIVNLNGEKSKFYEGFGSISRNDEEYHIIVNHNNYGVFSDIRNKCIGLDGSKIYLQIDSNLRKGNHDCVMEQSSRILTLGDVDARIIPNMFIDEDSVMARHGSIIGSFDEDEIFYFMSRGISYDEAVNLLMKGFLFSVMEIDLEKREFIMNSILRLKR